MGDPTNLNKPSVEEEPADLGENSIDASSACNSQLAALGV